MMQHGLAVSGKAGPRVASARRAAVGGPGRGRCEPVMANAVAVGAARRAPPARSVLVRSEEESTTTWDAEFNEAERAERIDSLANQLKLNLLRACATFQRPILTTALIAGDMVLLDAVANAGLLEQVPVIFVDTLHLFDETEEFLEQVEAHYGFQAMRYLPTGCSSRKEWNATYASDLYLTDIERYDELAKVQPLQRAIADHSTDLWINGRRRDHGFEREAIDVYEGGEPSKLNAIAHWTFRDCWDYLELRGVPYHPLHDEGYPSVGDVQSTLPVPREEWFKYAGERKGRWQGQEKTECGIHVASSDIPTSSQLPGAASELPQSSELKA